MMKIVDVETMLAEQQLPLTLTCLRALKPDRDTYRAMLLQPQGMIIANNERVGHSNQNLGSQICRDFLLSAEMEYADLAVAPEYCVPWSVVKEIIGGQIKPNVGSIWVLGCESISPKNLAEIAESCRDDSEHVFCYEQLDPRQVAQKSYVDPLVYVFWTRDQTDRAVMCFLVQFKTEPCRDYLDIEQTSLCVGRKVYAFNRGNAQISLLSIICSDAFEFEKHVDKFHPNCLLIHIQLNPKPAHVNFSAYRRRLCSVGSNSHVELLCLNWAENIKEDKGEGKLENWKNVAGSAWYAPQSKFRAADELVDELHHNGIYYNILDKRWHAFILNYEGHIAVVKKQKLFFIGQQALAPISFIAVEKRLIWDTATSKWNQQDNPNDGFAEVLESYTNIAGPLSELAKKSPLAVERAIELIMGPSGNPTNWYTAKELNAFGLHPTEESICRVTVHQEKDINRPGVAYRRQRLQRTCDAKRLSSCAVSWPARVMDLGNGFEFSWRLQSPHHNVKSNIDAATLVYLADQADDKEILAVSTKIMAAIRSHVGENAEKNSKNLQETMNEQIRASDRVCIVFRRDDEYCVHEPKGTNNIDIPSGPSPVDIAEACHD